jgi:hypothetical protein
MRIDERACRKPGYSEGIKVTMADGQQWAIPKPRIRFKPRIVDGKVEIGGGPSFGPEFDDKLDVLFGVRGRSRRTVEGQIRSRRPAPCGELRSDPRSVRRTDRTRTR